MLGVARQAHTQPPKYNNTSLATHRQSLNKGQSLQQAAQLGIQLGIQTPHLEISFRDLVGVRWVAPDHRRTPLLKVAVLIERRLATQLVLHLGRLATQTQAVRHTGEKVYGINLSRSSS